MTQQLTLDQTMVNGLTPIQERNGMWYKRDDLLAYSNGVSGKVRTALWHGRQAIRSGADRLVYGGRPNDPALARIASTANYLGLQCTAVIGYDIDRAVERHAPLRYAVDAGADLQRAPAAFAAVVQKHVRDVVAELDGAGYHVPLRMTAPLPATPEDLQHFLAVDGPQVRSLEDTGVDTLVLSIDSANAAAGVLWGLHTNPDIAAQLQRVVLVGVGPDRFDWLLSHLRFAGVRLYELGPDIEYLPMVPHFATMYDRMPEYRDGIDFYELCEGKTVRFLDALEPDWWTARDGRTCLWVVSGPE